MRNTIAIPPVTRLVEYSIPKGPSPFYFSELFDPKKFPAKRVKRFKGRLTWAKAAVETNMSQTYARVSYHFMGRPVWWFSPTNWKGSMLAWDQRKAMANLKAAR